VSTSSGTGGKIAMAQTFAGVAYYIEDSIVEGTDMFP